MAFFMARRRKCAAPIAARYSRPQLGIQLAFSLPGCPHKSPCRSSAQFFFEFVDFGPFRPMTTPTRGKIVIRQRVAARSIRIFGTEADSSFFFRISRIFGPPSAACRILSFGVHFERQSLVTAMRRPIGFVFVPYNNQPSDSTILMWQFRFRIGPAEPRALGLIRFMVVAVPATASLIHNVSGFKPLLFSALARADFRVLATSRPICAAPRPGQPPPERRASPGFAARPHGLFARTCGRCE